MGENECNIFNIIDSLISFDNLGYRIDPTILFNLSYSVLLLLDRVAYLWLIESNICPYGVGEYGNWFNPFLWISVVFVAKGINLPLVTSFIRQ